MTKAFWLIAAAALLALPACGGSDTESKGGNSSGSGGGGQTSGGDTTSGGSTSGQTCTTASACENGACACTDGPNKDQPCCDQDDDSCTGEKCDSLCKVCM